MILRVVGSNPIIHPKLTPVKGFFCAPLGIDLSVKALYIFGVKIAGPQKAMYSIGSVLFVQLTSAQFFKEKLGQSQHCAPIIFSISLIYDPVH